MIHAARMRCLRNVLKKKICHTHPRTRACGAYNAEATSTLVVLKIMPAGSQDSSEAMSGWVHKGLAMSWPFLALSVVILLTLQNGNDINITSDTGPAIEVRESSLWALVARGSHAHAASHRLKRMVRNRGTLMRRERSRTCRS